MSIQIFKWNNRTKKYLNITNNNNLSDEEYQFLIISSLIKNIVSILVFFILLIIKYLKIYKNFFNDQNNQIIIRIICFSGGFFFYISFLYANDMKIFIIFRKDLSSLNSTSNINNLEFLSFICGFLLIFFIRKILTNSISFYIPLINRMESKITNKEIDSSNQKYNSNNNILTEISEADLQSFTNVNENIVKNSTNSFIQKKKKYTNIEMHIIDKKENEFELRKEKIKKEHSFNKKNMNNNANDQNNLIFNRPFKDADNDEETNEEFFLSSNEKINKKIYKRASIKNKKLLSSQIPKFNLNPSKVKKNEKVKEENIHKIGTKINKEVFDIVYKSKKELENKIITINLCNKDFFKLIINIIVYNLYFLFIGILVGLLNLEKNLMLFVIIILLMVFIILYEKNNIIYNNDIFKDEPIIQKTIFVIFDLIFPIGIILGDRLINFYYQTEKIKLFIIIKGICCGNILFFSTFLLYFEETKNNEDIQNKFLFFSLGTIISFIINCFNL